MKHTYRILPCYTGDVSGACSALYELGGMVVIHDPSGCNSTYNTHDETRWYDQNSLIFITGFSEMDAILGNEEKFISEIRETAAALTPKFIALVSSPIPYLTGMDFPALARQIEEESGIETFFIQTNGMHDYVSGGSAALAEVARRFVRDTSLRQARTVNLLGMTPLDYLDATGLELRHIFEQQGWQVRSCWAMGSTLEEIALAGQSSLNVVVSALGMDAAKVLHRRFGTPYVVGAPIGSFRTSLREAMENALASGKCQFPCRDRMNTSEDGIILIGEPVIMGSLASAIQLRCGKSAKVLCPLEADPSLLSPTDRMVRGEADVEQALRTAKAVVADPLYRWICPKDVPFYDLSHEAFSGRCGWKQSKNLLLLDL